MSHAAANLPENGAKRRLFGLVQFLSGRMKDFVAADSQNLWLTFYLRALILLGAWLRFFITITSYGRVMLTVWLPLLSVMTLYTVSVLRRAMRPGEILDSQWYGRLILADTLFLSVLYVLSANPSSDLYLFYLLPVLVAAEHFDIIKAIVFFAVISVAFLVSFTLLSHLQAAVSSIAILAQTFFLRWVFFFCALFVAFTRTHVLRENSRELEAVRATALKVSANENLESRLTAVLEATKEILLVQGCKLYLPRRDSRELVLRAATGLRSDRLQIGSSLPMDGGIAGHVMQTGEPYIEPNYRTSRFRIEEYTDMFVSVLEVPLIWGNKPIGVLGIFDDRENRFGLSDQHLLEKFAAHVAVAIHDIELVEKLDRQSQGLRGLIVASNELLNAAPQNSEVLRAVAHHGWMLAKVFTTDPQYVLVALVNEAGIIDFAAAMPPSYLQKLQEQVVNIDIHAARRGVVGRAIAKGEFQYVRNVNDDLDYIPFNKESKVQLALPIRGRDRIIGVLSLEHSDVDGLPLDLLLEPLQGLAAHAAAAIENVQLFEEIQKRESRAQLLREWAARLSSAGDLSNVANLILEGLRVFVQHDRATLQVLDDENRTIVASYNIEPSANPILTRPLQKDRLIRRALDTKDVFVLPDPQADLDWEDLPDTHDVKTWCCAPLLFATKPIAIITIDHTQPAQYPDDLRNLLRLYLSHASSTLHAVILFEDKQRRLDQVQVMLDYMADQRNLAMIGLVFGESIHHAAKWLSLAKSRATEIAQNPGSDRTAERAHDILKKILDYQSVISKFTRRAVETPASKPLNIREVVDQVLKTKRLGPIAVQTRYELSSEIILAPEIHLRQIFHVIIQNAINAMTTGGTLTISATDAEVNAGPGVVVAIADTGRGIPPDRQTTLFEVKNYESSEGGGLHMGLVWARSFIRTFGGDITYITSRRGTTMSVHIPRELQKFEERRITRGES